MHAHFRFGKQGLTIWYYFSQTKRRVRICQSLLTFLSYACIPSSPLLVSFAPPPASLPDPEVLVGLFPARRAGDGSIIEVLATDESGRVLRALPFLRQQRSEGGECACVADFVQPAGEGGKPTVCSAEPDTARNDEKG